MKALACNPPRISDLARAMTLREVVCRALSAQGVSMQRIWNISSLFRVTGDLDLLAHMLIQDPFVLARHSPPLITYSSSIALAKNKKDRTLTQHRVEALVVDRMFELLSGGNTPYAPTRKFEQLLRECEGEAERDLKAAVKQAITTHRFGRTLWSTTRQLSLSMQRVEKAIRELAAESEDSEHEQAESITWSDSMQRFAPGVTLNSKQQAALVHSANKPGLAITGGPGTGKTTVVVAINSMWADAGATVYNLAFSGKAVKVLRDRLPEGTHCYTLHRFLRIVVPDNEDLQLEGSIVVCDEASMVDVALFDELLTHVNATQSRLILVGDPNQLPPVGLGAPFNDLIGSLDHPPKSGEAPRFPHVQLTTTNRYAEDMATFVEDIAARKWTPPACLQFIGLPKLSTEKLGAGAEWRSGVDDIKHRILALLSEHPELRDLSKTMYLSPQHDYVCGTKVLSTCLQDILNPHGRVLRECSASYGRNRGISMRDGDIIVRITNKYGEDQACDHYNGDDGVLRASPGGGFEVNYLDGTSEKVSGREVREDFELGYVRTVHKSQGGEVPNVVVIGPTTCHSMWARAGGRRLLTVAVSRAQKAVYMLGHQPALRTCLQSPDEQLVGRMFALPSKSNSVD